MHRQAENTAGTIFADWKITFLSYLSFGSNFLLHQRGGHVKYTLVPRIRTKIQNNLGGFIILQGPLNEKSLSQ